MTTPTFEGAIHPDNSVTTSTRTVATGQTVRKRRAVRLAADSITIREWNGSGTFLGVALTDGSEQEAVDVAHKGGMVEVIAAGVIANGAAFELDSEGRAVALDQGTRRGTIHISQAATVAGQFCRAILD
jgi:hypothetical protein